jgi:Protein of unknown function (DUF3309)
VISFLFSLLIVLLVGTMPLWPYSRSWVYYPSGLVAVTFSVLILLAISGRLQAFIETTWPDTRQDRYSTGDD